MKTSVSNFSISKAAAIIGMLSLASRLLGLVRDRLFAGKFGAGDTLDVYYAAFRIPDLVFNLLILGTLSAAFIPIFTEWLVKDARRAQRIANTVLNSSVLVVGFLCLLLYFFAEPLTKMLVPGFSEEKLGLTVMLTRLLLISPVIFTASNVFGSILNSQKRFFVASLAPLLYNCGIIFGLLYFYPHWGLQGLGWGVVLGASMHLLVQVIESWRWGFVWQPVFDFSDKAVQKIGMLFVPRIFGLDTTQVSLLIGSVVGSLLSAGSITVLNLAHNLQAVPVGLFGISVAMASFPALAEFFAKEDASVFIQTLFDSICKVLFFIIPISVLMLLLRAYIVRLAYGSGQFSWEDTILTFNTLGIFSISLFSQALAPLLARAFYARQDTKTPVLIGLGSIALNIILSYLFAMSKISLNFEISGISFGFQTGGVVGIALGFVIASIVNFLLLFAFLHRELEKDSAAASHRMKHFDGDLAVVLGKIIFASLCMGIVGYASIYLFEPLVDTRTGLGILFQSGLATAFSVAVYFLVAKWVGLKHSFKTGN